jgi:hypothetical protein
VHCRRSRFPIRPCTHAKPSIPRARTVLIKRSAKDGHLCSVARIWTLHVRMEAGEAPCGHERVHDVMAMEEPMAEKMRAQQVGASVATVALIHPKWTCLRAGGHRCARTSLAPLAGLSSDHELVL